MTKCRKVIIATAVIGLATSSAQAGGTGEFIAGVAIGAIGKTILDQAIRGNKNSQRGTGRTTTRETTAARAERSRVREETKQVQTRLVTLGFSPGAIDGGMGPKTKRAIGQFQTSIGHAGTGLLTAEQTAILFARANGPGNEGRPDLRYPPPPSLVEPPEDTGGIRLVDPGPEEGFGSGNPQHSSDRPDAQENIQANFSGTLPEVLGIRLGTDAQSARSKLETEGLTACTETGRQLVCKNTNTDMEDMVTLAYTRLEAETRVHTILRSIKFEQPVGREHVLKKLADSYPDLVTAPDHRVFASRDCASLGSSSGRSTIDGIMNWSKQATPVTESIGSLASSCGYFYSFDLASTTQVKSVSITLFEGGPITEAMQRESDSVNPLVEQVRF